jgi:hypothetical protein
MSVASFHNKKATAKHRQAAMDEIGRKKIAAKIGREILKKFWAHIDKLVVHEVSCIDR